MMSRTRLLRFAGAQRRRDRIEFGLHWETCQDTDAVTTTSPMTAAGLIPATETRTGTRTIRTRTTAKVKTIRTSTKTTLQPAAMVTAATTTGMTAVTTTPRTIFPK